VVEDMPEFPGGMQGLLTYIGKNLQYPANARENNVQGRVMVSFVVNEDGHLSDFKVEKSANDELDNEAIRMAKSMPNWKPGSHEGKPVKVRYTIPINFRLN
jgi:TonB family protein